jgi:glycosyltransferase involved in cell wall biosynthesis
LRVLMVYQTARMQGSSAVFRRRAKALAKVLVKQGDEVLLAVPRGEAEEEPLVADRRCRVQEVDLCCSVRGSSGTFRSWLALPGSSRRLAAIARDFRPDVAIVSTHDPFMQIEALRAARAAGALLVAHVPDSWYLLRRFRSERLSPWIKMQLEGWVLRRADRVLCVTETHRRLVRDGYGLRDDRTAVLRNGIDLAEWPALDLPKTADLLHIGPIRVYYDDSLLLRGLARLCEKRPQTRVRFLGVPDGKLAAEQLALAERLNLAEQLDVQGLVAPDEVAKLGAAARLGIVAPPEGMESAVFVKLYEYLAMGLPAVVLGNSEGENAGLVREHGVGLVCPDEETFAEEVSGLLSDRDRLQGLSARARRTAALYDYDRTISEWYESDLLPLVKSRERDCRPSSGDW